MTKFRMWMYIAFLVSMLVHLVLFNAALNTRWIRNMFAEAPGRDFFRVDRVMPRDTPENIVTEASISLDDILSLVRSEQEQYDRMKEEEDREKLLEEREFIPFDASEKEIYDSIKQLFEDEQIAKQEAQIDDDPGKSMAQEILAIEKDMLQESIEPSGWSVAAIPRGTATSDFVYIRDPAKEPGGLFHEGGIGRGEAGRTGGLGLGIGDEFLTREPRIPGIIKPPVDIEMQEIETSEIVDTFAEDISDIRKYSPLDDMLMVTLYTYHEPGDPDGFFQINIRPRTDRKDFEVIPKDIVFIIDSSGSIVQARLEKHTSAIDHAITRLNKEDRFNIVEFKNYTNALSDGLVTAEPSNRLQAGSFLRNITSGGKTDVYQAFSELITDPPSKERPYILMLLTDGRPNAGVVADREIINSITRKNQEKASIYAFASGTRINEYLLDLLSFRNKGASRFETRYNDIDETLKRFLESLQNPILMNLNYNFASLNVDEVYPKTLPDLFLGRGVVIFGRFQGEGAFSMQLLGEAKGNTMEYVFQQNLTTEDNGSREVARLWAFHKIYHLIGRLIAEGESQEILREINALSNRFQINTPYF